MTDAKLVQNLNTLLGSDRSALRKKLLEVRQDVSKWENLRRVINKKTRQPIQSTPCLYEEAFDELNDPELDMSWIGDASYSYDILLNSSPDSGLDWDKKLAVKCGGTAKRCVVWASVLLPYYAIDTYCIIYTPKAGEFEIYPYTPSTKREKKILSQIRDIMKEHGFSRMTKKLAKRKVSKAITDLREKGEATVFDCLFSDIHCYEENHVRFTGDPVAIDGAGVCSGVTVGWRERIDRKGKVLERSEWRQYPSGDLVITHLDSKFRVTEIKVVEKVSGKKLYSEINLDVKKRKIKTVSI